MRTDEERRLAELLQRAVPQPPMTLSPADVRPAHRTGTGWLPAVAAACVLALLTAVGVLAVRDQRAPDGRTVVPAISPVTPRPQFSSIPAPSVSRGRAAGPWSARALTPVDGINSLAGGYGSLYATVGTRLDRYNPIDGRMLARVTIDADLVGPPLVTATAAWLPTVASGVLSLQARDPTTLRVMRDYPVAHGVTGDRVLATPNPAATRLFLGYGDRVFTIDPGTGSVMAQVMLAGDVTALAVSADGHDVYTAVEPSGGGSANVLTLDANSLTTKAETTMDGVATDLLATSGGLWLILAYGNADSVQFAPLADLGHHRAIGSGGGGIPSTVTVVDGTVWIGGPHTVSCADPATGAIRSSIVPSSGGLSNITRAGTTWAGTDATGIAVFDPPARCIR